MKSRIELVRAPNPSAMTLSGTNSYVIDCGNRQAMCIDPGPAIDAHVRALIDCAAAKGCTITLIALTHGHPDHAPAALPLAERTGASIAAHENSVFPHDRSVREDEPLHLGDVTLRAIDAPGHTFDHLVYYEPRERALFTGDVVLGEGYVVIAPPGGAMRPYQRTLQRLLDTFADAQTIFGGHGEPVHAPAAKLRDYLAHRETRQRELLASLSGTARTIPELVQTIYRDTNPVLWPAAARQMLAYLIALEEEGRIRSRRLEREATREEHAILNPEWENIVGREQAATIEQELGSMLRLDEVREYELSP